MATTTQEIVLLSGHIETPSSPACDSEIISDSELDTMTDQTLVEYAGNRIVKFAVEIRPVLIKVQQRFKDAKKAGRPFLGYTNFDDFCIAFWNYTGRQIRNIINGTPTPKKLPGGKKPRRKSNSQVVQEGLEHQIEVESRKARERGFEEGRIAERRAQEILRRNAEKSGTGFAGRHAQSMAMPTASQMTADLATFYAKLTNDLTALTKFLKSNPDPDERAKTETQELIRTLRTFSKDAAERAGRLDEALRVTVQ